MEQPSSNKAHQGKTRVLYLITKSNWGGAQRYVYDLATSLPKERFDVTVALGGTGELGAASGTLAARLEQHAIRTLFVRTFARNIFLGSDLRAFREILRIIRGEKPEVVHLNSSKAGGVGAFAARLAGVPRIIFTVHGLPHNEPRPFVARALIWLATWVTFLLCHRVIVLSHDNLVRARRFPLCTHKITLIHNGIAAPAFLPQEAARARLTAAADQHGTWIGTIAELTPNKNLSLLIETARKFKHAGRPFQIFLIGAGELETSLRSQIQAAGLEEHVHLCGFIPSAANLLKAFDIFVLPSLKEGLPYVLIEAGFASCAVAASRISGATDIIEDGVSGLLFDPHNAGECAKLVAQLLDDAEGRERLARTLNTRVTEQFSLEHMLDQTFALYRS